MVVMVMDLVVLMINVLVILVSMVNQHGLLVIALVELAQSKQFNN
jgi:hypothetical protein